MLQIAIVDKLALYNTVEIHKYLTYDFVSYWKLFIKNIVDPNFRN